MNLSKDRLGKFTGSSTGKLFVGGKGATRDKYILEKAEEIVRGHFKRGFRNFHTDHGHLNEYEGIENFRKVSGLIVEYLEQQFFEINANCGATPDAAIVDFAGVYLASVDIKCPTESFYEQKLMFIQESKPEFQNVPKDMYIQGQMQMMALTEANRKKGLPPVTEHYLVRYMTSSEVDEDGVKIEYNIPLEARIFYQRITADSVFQQKILDAVSAAAAERDLLVEILLKPIIPNQ